MNKNIRHFNSKQEARDAFLKDISDHRTLIQKAFDKYGATFCEIAEANYDEVQTRITKHDLSKLTDEVEMTGIIAYFYQIQSQDLPFDSPRRKYMYQKSLLAHYHNNTHYIEHWIEMENGRFSALEMDPASVVEMVLDWIAVGMDSRYITADKYWASRKDKKLINENTKKLVDKLIDVYSLSIESNT